MARGSIVHRSGTHRCWAGRPRTNPLIYFVFRFSVFPRDLIYYLNDRYEFQIADFKEWKLLSFGHRTGVSITFHEGNHGYLRSPDIGPQISARFGVLKSYAGLVRSKRTIRAVRFSSFHNHPILLFFYYYLSFSSIHLIPQHYVSILVKSDVHHGPIVRSSPTTVFTELD